MELARIYVAIEFEGADRIISFLASDEVKKGKFGESTATGNLRQLIQQDGFRIAFAGKQIQINFELPSEEREPIADAIDFVANRWRRTISTLSAIKDGKAKWVGMQFFFEEQDENASSIAGAIQNWGSKIGYSGSSKIIGLNFLIAVDNGGLFEGVTLQSYETRGGTLQSSAEPFLIDPDQFPILHAGMQFIVDINSKPRKNSARISETVLEITDRIKNGYQEIIDRGVSALLKGGI